MAEEELGEKYKRLASLVEELSKRYAAAPEVSEEIAKKIKEIDEKVEFKLKDLEERISALKQVPLTKKLKEEIIEDAKKTIEEEIKKIREIPELSKVGIFEGVVEKLSEKVESFEGRLAKIEKEAKKPIEELIPELQDMRDFLSASDKIISSKAREEVEKRLKDVLTSISEIGKDIRKLAAANERFSKEIEKIEERISKFKEEINKIVKNEVREIFLKRVEENVKKNLPTVIEGYMRDIEEKTKILVGRQARGIEDELKSMSNSLETIGNEIKELKKFKENFEANLLEVQESVRNSVLPVLKDSIKAEVEEALKSFRTEMKSEKLKEKERVKNLEKILTKRIIEKFKNVAMKEAGKIEEKSMKAVEDKMLKFSASFENYLKKMEDLRDSIDKKISGVNEAFSNLSKEVNKIKEKNEELAEKIEGIKKEYESSLAKILEEVEK
jgi:chromosome segregation ATPase